MPLLCVQWRTPDDGQRNYPKHVEFYSKNKFEKLVHRVGFILRIFRDARSPERQKKGCTLYSSSDKSNGLSCPLLALSVLIKFLENLTLFMFFQIFRKMAIRHPLIRPLRVCPEESPHHQGINHSWFFYIQNIPRR